MSGRPWTDADTAELQSRHAAGESLTSIAKAIGRTNGTVGARAARLGLDWDRSKVAAANDARRITLADRRTRIIERLYQRAETNLDRLTAPEFRTVMKATFGEEKVRTIDVVPPQDEKALVQSIGTVLSSAARLEAVDTGSTDAVRSVLSALGEALGVQTPDGAPTAAPAADFLPAGSPSGQA